MRTAILVAFYVVLIILIVPVLLVCMLFRAPGPILVIGKWAVALAPKILGIRIENSGLERFDHQKTYLFMANHASFLDGPLMVAVIPQRIRVILKKVIFKVPVLGQGMRLIGYVPVDRKGTRGGRKSIETAAGLMREQGWSFLIFPEGTRSLDGRLQSFRRGGFFLALESGVPIVPVSINGTFELMPKHSRFVRKGLIRTLFHEPIPVDEYHRRNMDALIDRVKRSIESGLDARDRHGDAPAPSPETGT